MRTVACVRIVVCVTCCAMAALPVAAQTPEPQQAPMVVGPPLPPATMMEGFRQPIGSVLTIGYDELGEVAGVSVEVREMRDSHGGRVRGVVVDVAVGQSGREQSFLDADEIPDLLKGLEALLAITSNPTQFKSFEVRYATKGELALSASSSRNRGVLYTVEVGRLTKARRAGLTGGEMHQLRTLFDAAAQKLATLVPDR
jgi:hypothetical protein